MLINENIVNRLVTAFNFKQYNEYKKITIDDVTYKVDFNKEDNTLVLTLTKEEDDSKLRDYVNSLNDETFQTACEKVEEVTGRTLGDWNKNNTSEEVLEMFKYVVDTLKYNSIIHEIKSLMLLNKSLFKLKSIQLI